MSANYTIDSVAALESVIGDSLDFVRQKVKSDIDDYARLYIEQAPLLFVATNDKDGNLDISPKGDAPGFVRIESATSLLIPERPGNKLAFGFRNILETGKIGLIFAIPGQRETLRINGRASLHNDPAELEALNAQNKPALLCTRVKVDECFFHCGKAMIRSKTWQPDSWPTTVEKLMVNQAATMFGGGKENKKAVEDAIEEDYRNELY